MTQSKVAARTVLVVEDDRLLNLFLSNLVVVGGFETVDACNADEAIAILETRSDIALLITSVRMRSDMDGVGLAHQVNRRWPSIKIIVVSGQPGLSEHDLPGTALFLAKPYHEDEMAFEIGALMNP